MCANVEKPDAEKLNAEAEIAWRICRITEERKLTQKQAAVVPGVDQPKLSALLRGRLEGLSSDRLLRFLNALVRDIAIVIRLVDGPKHPGGIRVLAAA